MNSSVTIRLPGLAIPSEDGKLSAAPDACAALEAGIPDEVLLIQICEGSPEALAILFRRYARMVRALCYRVLRDTSEADDLLQDMFLLIHRFCQTFDSSKGPARSWILQMTYRRAISRRRYLTARHFYTRVDLDETTSELADPRTNKGQLEDSIDGQIGYGGLQEVFETL